MESGQQSPQLKGFVIITLPPADNPSLGKTITAFTLSDDSPQPQPQSQSQSQQPHHQSPPPPPPPLLPIQSPPNPQLPQFSPRRSLFGTRRIRLSLLGIFLIALILWRYSSPSTLYEELSSSNEDREKPTSFIFPLYPKLGIREMSQRDIELKLGKFVRKNSAVSVSQIDDGMRHKSNSKFVSSSLKIGSTANLPVRGNIYPDGLYYTHMLVGSPPKHYFLDVDTGSDLTWIQCDAPCSSCAKCDYEIEYADQSSSIGVLTRDELHLTVANGSVTQSSVVFGCAYDQQGLLLNSLAMTDGILGLSRAKVSLPSQLASQGIINNVVGHCLTTDSGGGGYMFLGDDFVPYWQMTWIPMLYSPSTNFYQTEVVKMSYGNKKLSLGGQSDGLARVIFDSGSSYTYFTNQAYSDLVASLNDVSGDGLIQDASDTTLPICWRAKFPIRSVSDVKQNFKPLTLQFGSKWWMASRKLRIMPEGYLIVNNKGNACLGILDGSKVHDGSTVIIGDISLRGQLVVYDNVNEKIGWAQSDCVKPERIKSLPFFGGMDRES
ncbi:hypothetical protein TEA_028539 [Camellia sinensis var. sinensis]|uniref:Peptidase A1 domain-containing protein n=1 Tax=Camellia sinensis var. sinensis TaxID=542762 RepID=A0A4S4E1N3_CAMSN|nr:hypothetical protein TEA_028539 [Camellia sinensis var. sinensis]